MKKQFKIRGKVRQVEYVDTSTMGNSRYMLIIDDATDLYTVYTRPNSSLGVTTTNYRNKSVTATVSMYRGKLCIDSIEEA